MIKKFAVSLNEGKLALYVGKEIDRQLCVDNTPTATTRIRQYNSLLQVTSSARQRPVLY